ncbi:hypothetical protein [Tautonia plasticadhaerens]|uniref:Uncharacterized protein n=1 Tax=Tautonia plasticadhaerens TaxID=2527974 RepID=A0A518HC16_9BACT|nr:hypothetical protein [Tautonia plasticadhaerens]QDV38404.1 hypothetical protein ElP_63590 [Tautonia plasticadhaerens]
MSQPNPSERPDRDLIEFERAFGALSPTPGRLDRDRLMYLAGRSAARRSRVSPRAWQMIAAGFALVAIGEAVLLVSRPDPEPRIVERLVHVPAPSPPPADGEPAAGLASATDSDSDSSTGDLEREPDPVVILRRSPRPEGRRGVAEGRGPGVLSPSWLRGRDFRLGVDPLPEPPPLPIAMRPLVGAPDRPYRSELDALLDPGESS